MSDIEAKALSVTPPTDGNVIVLSGSTTAQRVKIPDAWRKGYVTIQARGCEAGYLFGGVGVAADITAMSTINGTTFAVTSYGTGACGSVSDGGDAGVDLAAIAGPTPTSPLYVSIDCDASAGLVRLIHSSGKRAL